MPHVWVTGNYSQAAKSHISVCTLIFATLQNPSTRFFEQQLLIWHYFVLKHQFVEYTHSIIITAVPGWQVTVAHRMTVSTQHTLTKAHSPTFSGSAIDWVNWACKSNWRVTDSTRNLLDDLSLSVRFWHNGLTLCFLVSTGELPWYNY